MTNYLNKNEAELGEKLLKNGYVISKQKDLLDDEKLHRKNHDDTHERKRDNKVK